MLKKVEGKALLKFIMTKETPDYLLAMKPHSKLTLGGYCSVKYPVLSDNDARKTHPLREFCDWGLAILVQ